MTHEIETTLISELVKCHNAYDAQLCSFVLSAAYTRLSSHDAQNTITV